MTHFPINKILIIKIVFTSQKIPQILINGGGGKHLVEIQEKNYLYASGSSVFSTATLVLKWCFK